MNHDASAATRAIRRIEKDFFKAKTSIQDMNVDDFNELQFHELLNNAIMLKEYAIWLEKYLSVRKLRRALYE
ncbi:MAG TPA: hypothetical protein ENG48_03345 [Candidatus Atribacteria bacterium]|nr:hypothetical protein [Candidatus Atribacteria bacterium]